jgi:hypothetical protein
MQPTTDLTERVLGQTQGAITLPDLAALRAASAHMAHQAVQELAIFSHDLDAPLYDFRDFLDAVRRLAIHGGPRLTIRILLFNPEPAVRKGHRLVELARHHASHIQIRRVPPEFHQHTEAYLLADRRGYVLRRLADVFEGAADFDAPLTVRRLHEQFDHLWELGDIPPELRRLQL